VIIVATFHRYTCQIRPFPPLCSNEQSFFLVDISIIVKSNKVVPGILSEHKGGELAVQQRPPSAMADPAIVLMDLIAHRGIPVNDLFAIKPGLTLS